MESAAKYCCRKVLISRYDFVRRYHLAMGWIADNSVPGSGIRGLSSRPHPYPEVTGYFIPTLINWGERGRAKQYARWLISIQREDGAWPGFASDVPYTFDTGQILKGLLAVVADVPEAESAVRKGCDWLLTQIGVDGSVGTPSKVIAKLPGGRVVSDTIHLYALEPLLSAAALFETPVYRDEAERAIAHYLGRADLTAFDTLAHFHAYVLEALVDLGHVDRALEGMETMARIQRRNGAVPAYRDVNWVCSTAQAQYSVIWHKLGDYERGSRAFRHLCSLQNPSGGFYGSYGTGKNYFPREEISWAVKYFLDAYHLGISNSFRREIGRFPSTIQETDGRLQEVVRFCGELQHNRLLDLGCGKGRYLRELQRLHPQADFHGVDISQEMLSYCPTDVTLRCGSLLALPYPSDHFDYVICIEALEHAVNVDRALAEISRVLRPGGRVLIVDKDASRLGKLDIEHWEQWFDAEAVLRGLDSRGISARHRIIAHDDPNDRTLFIAWEGRKRSEEKGYQDA